MKDLSPHSQTPFVGVSRLSLDEMEAQRELLDKNIAEQKLAAQNEEEEKRRADKDNAISRLAKLQEALVENENVARIAVNMSPDQATTHLRQKKNIEAEIKDIQSLYPELKPTGYEEVLQEKEEKKTQAANIRATVMKVGSLVVLCFVVVLFSGDWILAKYPGAAIYNEVSFQKVLFSLPVHLCSVAAIILCLNALFPGFASYFNPFNTTKLDFFDDFSSLSAWQRNIIALALFTVLLFSFVWIVSGKLD